MTPQLTSLLGWYKSHDMSNICGGEMVNVALNMLLWLHKRHDITQIFALFTKGSQTTEENMYFFYILGNEK